MGNQKQ